MPFFTDDKVGPVNYGLQDFKPTYGQSLGATFSETLASNPSSLGFSLYDVNQRNKESGERLTAYDAEAVIKDAGVQGLKVQDGQYNRQALDMIVERKRQETIRNDVMSRTEYSWGGTPVRALATVAGAVLDPVNIAAAFVPVVGEARIASMLGRTVAGSLERASARAAIGVAEGGVGAALVEPLNYYGHTQLQDDYHMSDSLLNIAFGAALGGGLHVTGGLLADKFRASDPYARFSGLDQSQAKTVLDFEHGIGSMTPDQVAAATKDWTPKMREASGLGPKVADAVPEATQSGVLDIPRGLSKEDFKALYEQYPKQVLESIAARVGERDFPDLPFKKLADTTPEGARQAAARELADMMRADLLGTAGNRAAPGEVAELKVQLATLTQHAAQVDTGFKPLAKELQNQGMSRKQAESEARKQLGVLKDELNGQRAAIEQKLDTNRSAAQAEKDLADLANGKVPGSMGVRVQDRANEILAHAAMLRATQQSAASVVDAVTPEVRQAAFRAALAHAVDGRMPDVDALVRGDYTLDQIKSVAARQASGDSLAVGDVQASKNAAEQLRTAPKDTGLVEAEAALASVSERLNDLKTNLEQNGMDPARTAAFIDQMKPFDDEIAKADNYRAAAKAAAICGLRD